MQMLDAKYELSPMMKMSSYDEIASEYYSERHITSRNFDAATASSLSIVKQCLPLDGSVLDLGAGSAR
jgi:hypothetical protein